MNTIICAACSLVASSIFFIDAYLEEFLCVGGQCGGVGDHVSPVGGVVTLIITSSQRNTFVENKSILGVCIKRFVAKLLS